MARVRAEVRSLPCNNESVGDEHVLLLTPFSREASNPALSNEPGYISPDFEEMFPAIQLLVLLLRERRSSRDNGV